MALAAYRGIDPFGEADPDAPLGSGLPADRPSVTVVVPALNEEDTIQFIVDRCRPYGDEVMVVDGHSTDRTRELAWKAGARVVLDERKGKGAALRLAAREAIGDVVCYIDADGSHRPADIPFLLQPIFDGVADLVVGSRVTGGSDEMSGGLPEFMRTFGSHFITLAVNYRFGVRLTDTQNGFRAIVRDVFLGLGTTENITTIEQEMIMKALRQKRRVMEIPIHEYRRRYGTSRFNAGKVAFRYVAQTIWGLLF
jgi:dolichol-phosphate mannosyltransferase